MKGYKKLIPLFLGNKGIRIRGNLSSDEFQKCLIFSAKVIEVNIVRERLGHPTNVDCLTDATNLYFAKEYEFDFICSSHGLEHVANL